MYHLVFFRNGQSVMRHLLREAAVSIGRDPSCDIWLAEDDISRIHATITWNGSDYVIADKSTNGTFVNNRRIKSRNLFHGDIIALGNWSLKFEKSGESQQRETVVKESNPTKILKYEAGNKELFSETIELSVTTPEGSKIEFESAQVTIGASPANSVVISDDPYVSGNHCIVKSAGDSFFLEDLNSKNGTVMDGRKVSKLELPPKGEFLVGKSKVKYRIKKSSEKLAPSVMTSMGPIIGKSLAMRELFSLVGRIAPSDATACIIGQSGTGKELVARHIHETSPRRLKPFVALNCGAIPENLIESELFGHEKGSFTSATAQHRGVFEQASGGTLFLDEIGEMPPDLQTRLLRVLETKTVRRVGGKIDVPIDARIIAATNRDLKDLVKKNLFREDLFFRLYVLPIFIPPLGERKEDVMVLVEHFLESLSPAGHPKKLSTEAADKLLLYNWPGNVRELKNTIQRAVLLGNGETIKKTDIAFSDLSICNAPEPQPMLEEQEKSAVVDALASTKGNISKAARRLGIARTTLLGMAKRFDIDTKAFRKTA